MRGGGKGVLRRRRPGRACDCGAAVADRRRRCSYYGHRRATPETNTQTHTHTTRKKFQKAAAKRLKVTGSGKVVARRSGKQHFNEKMSRAKKRELSKDFVLSKGDAYSAIGSLPYHGINR